MRKSISRRNAVHGPDTMQALFVHGMGRSPLSGWPMLHRLRRGSIATESFAYATSIEGFSAIRARLGKRICRLAAGGDYVLIGHSLGGILIRAALENLPESTRLPSRGFLLGSPVRASRLPGLCLAQQPAIPPEHRRMWTDACIRDGHAGNRAPCRSNDWHFR